VTMPSKPPSVEPPTKRQPSPYKTRLYKTKRWERLSRRELHGAACADPYGVHAEAGVIEPATQLDHVEPHHGDPVSFWHGKRQPLCHACHARKTLQERM
jgi:5-methylcytosine-specific restriction protein A